VPGWENEINKWTAKRSFTHVTSVLSITDRFEEFMRIEKVFVAAIALAFRLMSTASAEPIRIAMPSKSMRF
jgi:hypothetical protein